MHCAIDDRIRGYFVKIRNEELAWMRREISASRDKLAVCYAEMSMCDGGEVIEFDTMLKAMREISVCEKMLRHYSVLKRCEDEEWFFVCNN